MEGILIMLLYLVAGFFKNRRDKAKRSKIQSDPNWDKSKSSNDFNLNFENIFKDFVVRIVRYLIQISRFI